LRLHDGPLGIVSPGGGEFGGDHIHRKENREALPHVRPRLSAALSRSPVLRRGAITFASRLLQNGESIVDVKDELGHHSIKVTVDVYGHLVHGRCAISCCSEMEALSPALRHRAMAFAASGASSSTVHQTGITGSACRW